MTTTRNEKENQTRQCYECKGTMRGRRENYRYAECGLSSVVLMDVLVFHCKCGAIVPEIPALGILHDQLMLDLLRKKTLLCAEEVRFLRKMTGYSATRLAKSMSVTKETVSRWENDKLKIGGESDRLLRFVCLFNFMQRRKSEGEHEIDLALERVKCINSLNVPEILEQIEELAEGPKQIRINPETLAQFGSGPNGTDTTTVQ